MTGQDAADRIRPVAFAAVHFDNKITTGLNLISTNHFHAIGTFNARSIGCGPSLNPSHQQAAFLGESKGIGPSAGEIENADTHLRWCIGTTGPEIVEHQFRLVDRRGETDADVAA